MAIMRPSRLKPLLQYDHATVAIMRPSRLKPLLQYRHATMAIMRPSRLKPLLQYDHATIVIMCPSRLKPLLQCMDRDLSSKRNETLPHHLCSHKGRDPGRIELRGELNNIKAHDV